MSLSSIAREQREREAKKLNSFLRLGLVGSLTLHIGVLLSLNIGNLTERVAEVKDEPLEIEIVELPETEKLEIEQTPPARDNSGVGSGSNGGGSSGGSGSISLGSGSGAPASVVEPSRSPDTPSQGAIARAQTPISVAPARITNPNPLINRQKLAQTPKAIVRQPAPVTKVTAPVEIASKPKPVTAPAEVATNPKPVTAPQPRVAASPTALRAVAPEPQQSDRKLRDLLASTRNTQQPNIIAASKPSSLSDRQATIASNLRNQRANSATGSAANSSISAGNSPSGSLSNRTGSGSASVAGTGRGSGFGSGSGTGRGSGSGNGSGTGRGSGFGSGSGTGRGSGSGNGSGTGRGSGFGSGSGTGTGRGSGFGSGSGTGRGSSSTVATGAQNRNQRTAPPESNSNSNSRSDGIGCVRCSKPKYPDKARRRGLEGKAEISVDTDSKGNVTNVRLARSSGHSELDKAALSEARRWKLKPTDGGKRGVVAKVDFAIEGSERSRQRRERRKKRQQAEQRRTTPTTANASNSPRRSRNITPGETASSAPLTRRLRNRTSNQNATAPRRTPVTTSRRRVETLAPRRAGDVPQRRRQRAATPQASSQTRLRQSLRRQRPPVNRATPQSQTKLRQSLRQLRQNSQPATSPANE